VSKSAGAVRLKDERPTEGRRRDRPDPEGNGHVTFYVGVDDPQSYLDKAESLGGKTVMPVTEIPNMVTFALFADPEGHMVGVVKN
jgi:hypothetical protein